MDGNRAPAARSRPRVEAPVSKVNKVKELLARYRNDPHVWGRTKQVAGGLLIADGLVGLENPLDGKKTRPGILGSLLGVVFGVIFMTMGWFALNATQMHTDATTQGTVTSVNVNHGTKSDSCSLEASYQVGGQTYQAQTNMSSAGYCNREVGDHVTVNYQSAHPDRAQIKSRTGSLMLWIFPVVGVLITVSGIVTFIVRLLSILSGAVLVLSGRRDVKRHPHPTSDAAEATETVRQEVLALLLPVKRAWQAASAPAPVANPLTPTLRPEAAAVLGALGSRLGALTGATPTSAPAPQVPPTVVAPPPVIAPAPAVPAGWYPTADGAYVRYWDGSAWTEHIQPRTR